MLDSRETATGTIDRVEVETYKVPTELPESDGTLQWDHTDISIVTVQAQGKQGMGYTFAGESAAALIHDVLGEASRVVHLQLDPLSLDVRAPVRNSCQLVSGRLSRAEKKDSLRFWKLCANVLVIELRLRQSECRIRSFPYSSGALSFALWLPRAR